MFRNNMIIAVAAIALMVGAADATMAHGPSGQLSAGDSGIVNNNGVQRVNIKINNIAVVASNMTEDTNNNIAANTNTNTSTSDNTNASTNSNTGSTSNINTNNGGASASATSGSGGGASEGTVEGDEAAASSAAPIFLSTGDDVCMGSSSVGGQAAEFGFSVGSTWQDSNCVMLKNARELKNQGYDKAAKARLCMNEDNALAFELAGEPCPRALASTQAAIAKIRAWNPDYEPARDVAMAPVQLAALDAPASGQLAVLPPASKTDTEWLSGGFESFVATVKAFFQTLAEAGKRSQQPESENWALDLPE